MVEVFTKPGTDSEWCKRHIWKTFISKSNLTVFKQLPTVAAVISPCSALEFCFEIKDIICFSIEVEFFFAAATKSSGANFMISKSELTVFHKDH
jgi:hypothetical protein